MIHGKSKFARLVSSKCSMEAPKKTSVRIYTQYVRVQMYAYICTRTFGPIRTNDVYKKDEFYQNK